MQPTPDLIDELYRDKVRQARAMTAGQRLMAAAELFDQVCSLMASGVRNQYPDADDARVRAIVNERLDLARRLENLG